MFRLAVHQKFLTTNLPQPSPQPQHRQPHRQQRRRLILRADTGDGYTGNYTWDDGTYSGGDTGYYDNNSYNNYDNGTYDNGDGGYDYGNADGAYTGE